MKKVFQILAPLFFIIIITGAFSKNTNYPVTQFLITTIGFAVIYNILVLIKKENLFIYFLYLAMIVFLTYSYINSVFFIAIFSGIVIVILWNLTKKYLNNFKSLSR
ncbi:MAG: hypothetical protein ABS44_07625 [Chryseobacterium sp. SCN 40-13]|nr:MAG: hypothetical protein ABS44_07625 [Chryseobacterium sp. SCN 40-13]